MNNESLPAIFINAALINNFVLAYFLGICSFLGVSNKISTATRMGAAVTFVMIITSVATFWINALLEFVGAPFLRLISYIVVIAATVQLVEMFIRKVSPTLFRALGIFLPLITTNCAVLALALFQTGRGYRFIEGIVFALGAGAGFTLAMLLMAGLREKIELSNVPAIAQGKAITLLIAGILALSFMGFAGLGG